jgi:hypothetical protein
LQSCAVDVWVGRKTEGVEVEAVVAGWYSVEKRVGSNQKEGWELIFLVSAFT